MKVSILTLGCRTNQAESLSIEKEAITHGHEIVPITDNPELCIVNTCSVTSKADYQSRQLINRAIRSKAHVIVTGCYAQLHESVLPQSPFLTVLSNKNKGLISNYLSKSLDNPVSSLFTRLSKARPIIKVQEGCNNDCTYCSIPLARGRAQSIPLKTIIREILDYENRGFNEVVLTGTNIGQYGLELSPQRSFVWLLGEILDKTTIKRIRISSIEVNYIDEDFIELLNLNRLCKHLHIPLQSGDNKVLEAMKRPYLREDFMEKVLHIKRLYPDISIGSDIMVGFPCEGINQFASTVEVIEATPLSYFHVFVYSQRGNTPAAQMPLEANFKEIKERSEVLIGLSKRKRQAFIGSQIGKPNEMIIENKTVRGLEGTTSNYIKVLVPPIVSVTEKDLLAIRLTGFKDDEVYAEPVLKEQVSKK
jgi:threonylcarbamoyladenosine tRNA methylthiotransferase MtaB